ncbi:MAG: hypothetical protein ACREBB_01450 [Nitrosotalea sp.]
MTDEINWVWEIAKIFISFGIGLLVRKKVGRALVKAKKWLLNDIQTVDILAVREYPDVEVNEIEASVFDDIKNKIPSAQFMQTYPNGLMINLPIFGNLIAEIEHPIDEENYEHKVVKLILKTESSVRLTIRELKKIRQIEKYADNIFDSIEKKAFKQPVSFTKSYAVCDISRSSTLAEVKTFKKQDVELNATIDGTEDQLTIRVSHIDNLTDATEKYHLA